MNKAPDNQRERSDILNADQHVAHDLPLARRRKPEVSLQHPIAGWNEVM